MYYPDLLLTEASIFLIFPILVVSQNRPENYSKCHDGTFCLAQLLLQTPLNLESCFESLQAPILKTMTNTTYLEVSLHTIKQQSASSKKQKQSQSQGVWIMHAGTCRVKRSIVHTLTDGAGSTPGTTSLANTVDVSLQAITLVASVSGRGTVCGTWSCFNDTVVRVAQATAINGCKETRINKSTQLKAYLRDQTVQPSRRQTTHPSRRQIQTKRYVECSETSPREIWLKILAISDLTSARLLLMPHNIFQKKNL